MHPQQPQRSDAPLPPMPAQQPQMGPPPQQGMRPPPMGQQPPQQPPPPSLPWTQADTMALQKLGNALSTARGELDNGQIDEQGYQQYLQQIMPRLNQLQQRKQAEDQKNQQEQQMQVHQQAAQQQAIEQQNAEYRAQNMQKRVAVYTDPVSAKSVHLFEAAPNKWEQIKMHDDEPGEE